MDEALAVDARASTGSVKSRSAGGGLPRHWGPLAVGVSAMGSLAAVVFWLLHDSLIDDAYISLTYARNLAYHLNWGMLPDQLSHTATSPLNVLILGAVTFVVRSPLAALGIVYVLTAAALTFGLAGLGTSIRIGQRLAWTSAPLILLNPLLASTLGMETPIAIALLVFLAWGAVRADARLFGVVAGLTVLTRLDLVVFVAVLFLARPVLWRRTGRVAGWGAAVAFPWFTFSWVVLGSAIPDTLVIKQNQDWGSFADALVMRYGEMFPWAVTGSLVIPLLGILALVSWPWWRSHGGLRHSGVVAALGLGGAAYFGVFLLLGVPPYFWYYGPTLAALTVCCGALLALLTDADSARLPRATLAAIVAVALLPAGAGWLVRAQEGVPFTHMPVHDNWGRASQYAHIGRELGDRVGGATVQGGGIEIGTLAYYCRCDLVQKFSDRGRIADLLAERKRSSPLMRLNYHFLDPGALTPDRAEYRLRYHPVRDGSAPNWSLFTEVHGWGHVELHPVPEKAPNNRSR